MPELPERSLAEVAADALGRIRERRPLIHHITNYVVMTDTANVTLHIGASPVMAHAIDEVREMVRHAGALVLNIGTLDRAWIESMLTAGEEANLRGVPIVLDPVGAGATSLRTEATRRILEAIRVDVVRGNAAELSSIAGLDAEIRGVDSVSAGSPETAARLVAARTGGAAVVSGAVDHVADGTRVAEVRNGHALMGAITGSGCMATSMVAAFRAVEPDPFLAAAAGMIVFGIAGEIAAERSAGPGTFRQNLMDAVYALDGSTIRARASASMREVRPA
jgi:hydroxyethylthiazole kinase